jgi:hypothetical protein
VQLQADGLVAVDAVAALVLPRIGDLHELLHRKIASLAAREREGSLKQNSFIASHLPFSCVWFDCFSSCADVTISFFSRTFSIAPLVVLIGDGGLPIPVMLGVRS